MSDRFAGGSFDTDHGIGSGRVNVDGQLGSCIINGPYRL